MHLLGCAPGQNQFCGLNKVNQGGSAPRRNVLSGLYPEGWRLGFDQGDRRTPDPGFWPDMPPW